MGWPTLQTLQEPILLSLECLLPSGGFPNNPWGEKFSPFSLTCAAASPSSRTRLFRLAGAPRVVGATWAFFVTILAAAALSFFHRKRLLVRPCGLTSAVVATRNCTRRNGSEREEGGGARHRRETPWQTP